MGSRRGRRVVRYQKEGHISFDRALATKGIACGIDVHSKFYSVAILDLNDYSSLIDDSDKKRFVRAHFQEFPASAEGIENLENFLSLFANLRDIVMEATANYWRPVHHALCHKYNVFIANPRDLKSYRPKADDKDAFFLAELNLLGFIRPSLVPDAVQLNLRNLTRQRKKIIQNRVTFNNRCGSILLSDNILLSNVLSMSTRSAYQMIRAIIEGERKPDVIANLYQGTKEIPNHVEQIKQSLQQLAYISDETVFILDKFLEVIDLCLSQEIEYDMRIENLIKEYSIINPETGEIIEAEKVFNLLTTIPNFGVRTAQIYIAEPGMDMNRFPGPRHLCAWCGFDPRDDVSGGKVVRRKTRKGNTNIHSAVVQAAQLTLRGFGKDKQLSEYGWNYLKRSGSSKAKAVSAIGRLMVYGSYFMLSKMEPWDSSKYSSTNAIEQQIKNLKKLQKRLENISKTTENMDNEELQKLRHQAGLIAGSLLGHSDVDYVIVQGTENKPLENLPLRSKARNALQKGGLHSVSDVLMALFNQTILDVKGIGPKTLQHLAEVLIETGYIAHSLNKK